MGFDPSNLPSAALEFLTERHLATLSLTRPDGGLHVTPVGVTWDQTNGLARVITWAGSVKARIVAAHSETPAALCQVDGGRWLALHGPATLRDDSEAVAEAVARYAERYRPPKTRPDRVVLEIPVDSIVGRL